MIRVLRVSIPILLSLLVAPSAVGAQPAASPAPPAPVTAPKVVDSPAAAAALGSTERQGTPARAKRQGLRQKVEQEAKSMGEIGQTLGDRVLSHLPGVVAGVALLVLFWFSARWSARLLRRAMARAEADPALVQIAVPLVRLSILALGLLVAVEQVGIHIGSLLAGVGIAGLAFGLAAQETLANLVAGIALLWDRPFRIGDTVTVADTYGTVTGIGLRSTRVRTLEQREVTVPNKVVAQQKIINHSRYPAVRINVPVSIGYGEDLDRVRTLLLAAVTAEPVALHEPPAQVVVTALADSAVAVELRVWVATPTAESATLFHFLELAKRALDDAGIEIPFPQRTVHLAAPVEVLSAPRSV